MRRASFPFDRLWKQFRQSMNACLLLGHERADHEGRCSRCYEKIT